ncbi:Uncharacterised protein [Enterobacter cloacae]|uniref:Uncharacterized protein n=1 Tax=Enterobacter cloacae TaxID=550 RepID=A0A377LYH6_ENTCL|nr:Uncharacterised protein [Enterobacter cloacae]
MGWQFGFCHTFKLHVILQSRLTRFVSSACFCFLYPFILPQAQQVRLMAAMLYER